MPGRALGTAPLPGRRTEGVGKTRPGSDSGSCYSPRARRLSSNSALSISPRDEPLPPVDREFYVAQGETYTQQAFGTEGLLTFDLPRMRAEDPEYLTFNGAVGALLGRGALEAKVGETVRIYFGVGGPSKTSSLHVIGEVFDRVYQLGSLASPPLLDVQTVSVPPGGAVVVDLTLEEAGDYALVDHALARVAKGLVGTLSVSD
jgi:nitrite reductase (NO-forming)